MVSDEVVVFDNLKGRLYVVIHANPEIAGAYDKATNRLFWPVGNPGPDFDRHVRLGDNLFTKVAGASIVVKDGVAHCTCNGEVLEAMFKVPATGPIGLYYDPNANVDALQWRRVADQVRAAGGRLVALWGSDESERGRAFAVHVALGVACGFALQIGWGWRWWRDLSSVETAPPASHASKK